MYHKHCVDPDIDTLFHILNAIHSLNDKLKNETGENFFECNEFVALKALRNLFHHETELVNEVRAISAAGLPSISSDLIFLCLVPSNFVLRSFEQIDNKRRVRDESIIRDTLKWYGNVVNINPCIFNFAVHAFEKLNGLGLNLVSDEYKKFEIGYRFEENYGHSHFVTGEISCHAGSVEAILAVAFADAT